MIVTFLRSSSIGTLNICEAQYFYNYVLGLPSKAGLAASLGNIVHKSLELIALGSIAQKTGKKTFVSDEFGKLKVALIDSPLKFVELAYVYYKNEAPDLKWNDKTHIKQCFDWTIKATTLSAGAFDPRKRDIICPEKKFDLIIEKDWAKYSYDVNGEIFDGFLGIKGTVDLVTKINNTTIEVVDWKSGSRKAFPKGTYKNYPELSKDIQLRLYHYALCQCYPEYENIIVTIVYIKDGGPFTLCFERSKLGETEEVLRKYFDKIRKIQSPRLISGFVCSKICQFGAKSADISGQSICQKISSQFGKKPLTEIMLEYGKHGSFNSYGSGGGRSSETKLESKD